ncbi:MAG TPA: MerR family transcriptional regulator [Candidatus Nanopelagicales bacterium]|nr:MerR family transcriptional regulator [Candidatus Nanopelagicales bacterium]
MTAVASHGLMGIGDVLAALRPEFPDVTISKIRFLESEGLVTPQRTASGYRKFSHADVERLRYVLSCQRDQYLPLKVIRDHLEAIDRGLEPPTSSGDGPRVPRALVSTDGLPSSDTFRPSAADVRLSRKELLESSGLDDSLLGQLEGFGLISKRGSHYDGDALSVASTVAEMSAFGIEPRHLRTFKVAADREVGLVEQVVTPMLRQRDPESQQRADDAIRQLSALSVRLHASLVRAGLAAELRR